MSSHAHLSNPDPELAAYLKQHPLSSLSVPDDVATAQREWIKHRQPHQAAIDKARLCPGQ
jgi:hypothetical protein